MPVSYTHLDVYKRQVQGNMDRKWVVGNAFLHRKMCGDWLCAGDVVWPHPAKHHRSRKRLSYLNCNFFMTRGLIFLVQRGGFLYKIINFVIFNYSQHLLNYDDIYLLLTDIEPTWSLSIRHPPGRTSIAGKATDRKDARLVAVERLLLKC